MNGAPMATRTAEIQGLVERALAASTADGCVVIGSEDTRDEPAVGRQQSDHQRAVQLAVHDRDLDLRRQRGHPRRRCHPRGLHRRRTRRPGPRLRGRRARRVPGRGRRAARRRLRARRRLGRRAVAHGRLGLRTSSRRRSARSSPAGGRPSGVLFGYAEHQISSTFLGVVHRVAAPVRPAERAGGAERQVRRLQRLGLREPAHRSTSPTSTWPRWPDEVEQRLDWASNAGRAARRPLRDHPAAERPSPT